MARRRAGLALAAGTCAYFLLGADCGGFPVHAPPDAPFVPFDAPVDAPRFDAPPSRTPRPPDLSEDYVPTGEILWREGRWDVHVAAAAPDASVGQGVRLVIDAAGVVHAVHLDLGRNEVLYTRGTPSGFRTEHVGVQAGELGDAIGPSLAVARDGTVHVAYARDVELGATHAVRLPDGTWSRSPLSFDGSLLDGEHPTVALLSDGTPWFVGPADPVSTGPSSGRALDAIVPSGREPVGVGVDGRALRIDAFVTGDVAHALFVGPNADGLGVVHVATRTLARVWTTRALDDAWFADGTVGPDGTLHLAYARRAPSGWELVRTRGPADDGSHVDERVAISIAHVQGVAIAVAADGTTHVAWASPAMLYYATDAAGLWRTEMVGPCRGRIDMALDASGRPWIAHTATGTLLLATPGD